MNSNLDVNLVVLAVLGFLVNCIILYFIIKIAVKGALLKELTNIHKQLKLQNQYKTRELLKTGITTEELQKDIDLVFENIS